MKAAGHAVTDRHGRFSIKVPAGPSRTFRLVFPGAGGALGAARGVSVRVPASSTIHASRTHLSAAASASPAVSAPEVSAYRVEVSCSCCRVASAGSGGPSRTRGRTGRASGTCPTASAAGLARTRSALRIRRQNGYPFELGYSRALTVRVG